jgi:hypothetical protein
MGYPNPEKIIVMAGLVPAMTYVVIGLFAYCEATFGLP